MRLSLKQSLGMLVLLCAAACGPSEEPMPEEVPLAVISRQGLGEECTGLRDEALLLQLKQGTDGGARSCNYDDDCPWGSFCNESTRLCDWKCLEGGSGETACEAGKVCDCSGRCNEETGGGPLVLPTRVPRVDVTPGLVEFPAPDGGTWGPQRAVVGLAVMPLADGGAPQGSASTPVTLTAGLDLEVACGLPDGGMSAFGGECALGPWSLTPFGVGLRGEIPVQLRPRTGSTLTEWSATLVSPVATPPRTLLRAGLAGSSPGSGGGARAFWGVVELSLGAGGPQPLRLTVEAWANDDYLLIHDETRTLSPSGKVRLSRQGAAGEKHGAEWLPSGAGSSTADAMTAEVAGFFTGAPREDGALSGSFFLRLPRPISGTADAGHGLEATFRLSRQDDMTLTACTYDSQCQAGFTCESSVGVCVTGVGHWTSVALENGAPRNTLVSEQRQAWDTSEAQGFLASALTTFGSSTEPLAPWQLARGLLCNQGGTQSTPELQGFPLPATRAEALSHVMTYSGDLRCLNGQPPYVSDFFTQLDRHGTAGDVLQSQRLTTSEMLKECLADLQRPPTGAGAVDTRDFFQKRFGALYDVGVTRPPVAGTRTPGRCLNLARFFAALHLSARDASSRDQRTAGRLLQQWIGVHGYVAQQVLQNRELADFLPQEADIAMPTLADTLDRFEKGWDVLLDGASASALPGNSDTRTCSLLNPDYRVPPPPTVSWRRTEAGLVQTRGQGVRWNRSRATFFYKHPDAWAACPSTTPNYLETLSYAAEDLPAQARSLWTSCQRKGDVVEATVQAVRGQGLFSSVISTWYPTVLGGASTLAFAVVDHGDRFMLHNGQAQLSPFVRNYAGQHPSLRPPYALNLYPPAGATLAAWDFPVEAPVLAYAASHPDMYDAATADLASLTNEPHHDAAVGLPVSILEGLTTYVRLLDAELARAERSILARCAPVTPGSDRDAVLRRFGRAMRYVVTLEALATAARERERTQCQAPAELPWDRRWLEAQSELALVRQKAFERVRTLSSCRPFGFPQDEAPLFFNTNPVGDLDRYFATSNYLYQEASTALGLAESAASSARLAWVNRRQNEVQQRLTEEQNRQRLLQMKRDYGAPLIQICGLESSTEDALDLFDSRVTANPLRPETCFLKRQLPQCQVSTQLISAAVKLEHARFTLCTWKELGAGESSRVLPSVRTLINNYSAPNLAVVERVTGTTREFVVRLGTDAGTDMSVTQLYGMPIDLEGLDPKRPLAAQQTCAQRLGGTGMLLPTSTSIGRPLEAGCYAGEMGQATLTLKGAQQSLEVAQSQWGEYQERFDIAHRRCTALESNAAAQTALNEDHRDTMKRLINEKLSIDRKVNNLSDVNSKSDGIIGAFSVGGWVGAVWGGLKLLGGAAENRAKDASLRKGAQIERVQQDHQAALAALQLQGSVQQCFIEAQAHLVGIRTAALQVDRVETDVESALLTLDNLEARVRQVVAEGQQVVARESARTLPSFTHDFWVSAEITQARKLFETARKTAFLFAKALEYEKQQSQPALGAILGATGPSMLRLALNDLTFSRLDHTVNGSLPDDRQFVLQLREHVLKLGSRTGLPQGERNLTDRQRFAYRLLSPESAVYDDAGNYLGQGLRFTIPDGSSVFRCAERVWEVHVHLSGGERLNAWTTNKRATLLVRKRNTFSSRLCDREGWQVNAVRPSLRSSALGTPRPGEEGSFTPSTVRAGAGMQADDFEVAPDGDGTTQWMGRGLYGEYEVIFPWNGLIYLNGVPTGFPLDDVQDVFVRFDEVSASTSRN